VNAKVNNAGGNPRNLSLRSISMARKYTLLLILCLTGLLAASLAAYAGWRYSRTPEYRVRYGSPAEKQWAVRLLVEEGAEAHDWSGIERCIESPHVAVALTAVSALGNARRAEAIDTLIALVDGDRAPMLRLRALEALAQLNTERAWKEVKSRLDTEDPRLREAAISHLVRRGRRDAIPAIRSRLEDSSAEVRRRAAEGLRELLTPVTHSGPLPDVGSSLVFEAERGSRFRGNFEIAPSARLRSRLPHLAKNAPLFAGLEDASGGWVRNMEGAGGNHEWLGGEAGSIDIGRSDYPLVIPRDGRYRLWTRAWWMDKCGNSFNAWFDHGKTTKFNDADKLKGPYRRWAWFERSKPVHLTAGVHTLHVQAREDGIRIDQFALLPDGERPEEGPATVNYEPLALLPHPELALSRGSRIIHDDGHLHATAWILRGGHKPLTTQLRLEAAGGRLSCAGVLPITIPKDERVQEVDFTVTYPPDAPRKEYVIQASLRQEGQQSQQARRLIVRRPWHWRIAGPFPRQRTREDVLLDPNVEWRSYPAEKLFDPYGRMDFESVFGNGTTGWVYLKARVRSEEEGPLLWLLNSDDSSRVWLDDELVLHNPRNAPSAAFLTRARRTIPPGDHIIVAECYQKEFPDGNIHHATQNYWLFRLRVRRSEHEPADLVGLEWIDSSDGSRAKR
jgi:hypothetical protein